MPDEYLRANAKIDTKFFWCVFYRLNQPLVDALIADFAAQHKKEKKVRPEKPFIATDDLMLRTLSAFPKQQGKSLRSRNLTPMV